MGPLVALACAEHQRGGRHKTTSEEERLHVIGGEKITLVCNRSRGDCDRERIVIFGNYGWDSNLGIFEGLN